MSPRCPEFWSPTLAPTQPCVSLMWSLVRDKGVYGWALRQKALADEAHAGLTDDPEVHGVAANLVAPTQELPKFEIRAVKAGSIWLFL